MRAAKATYEELTRSAASAMPLQSLIDPDAIEFLKPGDMPARIQAFCERTGQPLPQKAPVRSCAVHSKVLLCAIAG
jgi:rhamnulokinase